MKNALLSLFITAVFLQACLPPAFRAHPTLAQRAAAIKTVLVAPPKVEVFELGAGGVREKMDEWSNQGRNNIIAALEKSIAGRASLRMRLLNEESLPPETKAELEQTSALFEAVDDAILRHTYGPEPERFAEKLANFDYSLGAEVQALKKEEADVLLFIRAVDHVSSQGRIAQQVALVLVAAALGVVVVPQGGATALSAAFVDAKTGAILWHKFIRMPGHDLRKPESANQLVAQVLADLPLR